MNEREAVGGGQAERHVSARSVTRVVMRDSPCLQMSRSGCWGWVEGRVERDKGRLFRACELLVCGKRWKSLQNARSRWPASRDLVRSQNGRNRKFAGANATWYPASLTGAKRAQRPPASPLSVPRQWYLTPSALGSLGCARSVRDHAAHHWPLYELRPARDRRPGLPPSARRSVSGTVRPLPHTHAW